MRIVGIDDHSRVAVSEGSVVRYWEEWGGVFAEDCISKHRWHDAELIEINRKAAELIPLLGDRYG